MDDAIADKQTAPNPPVTAETVYASLEETADEEGTNESAGAVGNEDGRVAVDVLGPARRYLRKKVETIRRDRRDRRFERMQTLLAEARKGVRRNETTRAVDLSRTNERGCDPRRPEQGNDDKVNEDEHGDAEMLDTAVQEGSNLEEGTRGVSNPAAITEFPCTFPARVRIPRNIFSPDKGELGFVPSHSPDKEQAIHDWLYNESNEFEEREKRITRGPKHVREDNEEEVRLTLEDLRDSERFNNLDRDDLRNILIEDVFGYEGEKQKRLEKKVNKYFENPETIADEVFVSPPKRRFPSDDDDYFGYAGDISNDVSNAFAGHDPHYQRVIANTSALYCARCKQYECNLHYQPNGAFKTPSLQLRYEVAMETEDCCPLEPVLQDSTPLWTPELAGLRSELTPLQQSICRRVFLIYGLGEDDREEVIKRVATFLNAPTIAVRDFCRGFSIPERDDFILLKEKTNFRSGWHAIKNYPRDVLFSGKKHCADEPCVHDHPCRKGMCRCLDQGVFCMKTCGWGVVGKNGFRGCECEGPCGKNCTCRVYGRECDPDLCRCDTCRDPGGEPHTDQACEQDNITMRRGVQTLVAVSDIVGAGLGLFSRHPIAAGQFVGEYLGEVLPPDEGERRGQLYDIFDSNSHVALPNDWILDANVMCNEMRFANAPKKGGLPNVRASRMVVDGMDRIGFYALQDIPEQAELLLDYGDEFHSLRKGTDGKRMSRKRKHSDTSSTEEDAAEEYTVLV